MIQIQLPRSLVTQLLTQAQQAAEQEICGLIGQSENGIFSCYPITNIAVDVKTQFEMAPQQQIAAFRHMRAHQQSLFAIYHSHPQAEARPSVRDQALIAYPEALYLIISLNNKGILQMRGFYWQTTFFEEVILKLLFN
ncbi:MAG: M67 family metallopeptidase [Pseudomonadota bacterium]|nr:M67 family metallopeptidase [Pseudomonadota bacterium]